MEFLWKVVKSNSLFSNGTIVYRKYDILPPSQQITGSVHIQYVHAGQFFNLSFDPCQQRSTFLKNWFPCNLLFFSPPIYTVESDSKHCGLVVKAETLSKSGSYRNINFVLALCIWQTREVNSFAIKWPDVQMEFHLIENRQRFSDFYHTFPNWKLRLFHK